MDLLGRRAVVLGAGLSGRAAARFLLARGSAVDLWDDAPADRLSPDARALAAVGARLLPGGPALATDAYDLAVVSPGIAAADPRVVALAGAGVEVVGELELGYRFLTAPVIAITGTNGKTTVTTLLGEILQAAGHRVFVGGNLGTPLVEAAGGTWDLVVAEVSSYQLETIRDFRPRVAVLLNITDDHFDRHGTLEGYARAKARIFENQGPGDAAVVNRDDPVAWALGQSGPGAVLPYSTERVLPVGAWAEGDDAIFLLPGVDGVRVPRGELLLPGRHNLGNVLAACLTAAWVGADPRSAWVEARRFRGLKHRLEAFLEWQGVRFLNDSKATNVDAAVQALETVGGPTVWVGGGVDKGGDYRPLAAPLGRWVRQGVLVGAAAPAMAAALEGAAPLTVARDWPEAVRLAVAAAEPGDTVLLAPACSSFDFFSGYGERGDTFKELCRAATQEVDRDR